MQPITGWKAAPNTDTHFEVHPEAFRMCFYLYILLFFALASFVTLIWGDIDLIDNEMVDRFGYSTFSVIFSDPPFSLFASTLWFPATILLLSFELFDYIRVYHHYHDDDVPYSLSRCFFVYYSISTLIECVGVVCFSQIFATSPTEHIYMHSWPYIIFMVSLWLMVNKRFLYLYKVNVVSKYGVIHVISCSVITVIGISLYLPNLFGAKLWESHSWTMTLQKINDALYAVLMVVVSMVIYAVIGTKLDTVIVTVHRSLNAMNKSGTQQSETSHRAVSVITSESAVGSEIEIG